MCILEHGDGELGGSYRIVFKVQTNGEKKGC